MRGVGWESQAGDLLVLGAAVIFVDQAAALMAGFSAWRIAPEVAGGILTLPVLFSRQLIWIIPGLISLGFGYRLAGRWSALRRLGVVTRVLGVISGLSIPVILWGYIRIIETTPLLRAELFQAGLIAAGMVLAGFAVWSWRAGAWALAESRSG